MKISIRGAIIPNEDKWIYDLFGMDNVTPGEVVGAIEKNTDGVLDVEINSGGGDIGAGSEIYAAIQAFKGRVNIHVVGYACSAASVIACAGHSDMVRTGLFMYHNVSGGARGDYHAMDQESRVLQVANRAIAAAYTAKTGMKEAELLQQMDAETWITAEDAVKLGFIDEIAENQNLKLRNAGFGLLSQETIDRVRAEMRKPDANGDGSGNTAAANRLKLLSMKVRNLT